MIATSCEKSEWETNPDAWKVPPEKAGKRKGSYLGDAHRHRKQIKPSQEATHNYSAEKERLTPDIVYLSGPVHINSFLSREQLDMAVFRAIATQWERETGHYSVFSQKANHPLYQAIIAIGDSVLPTLIAELKDSPRTWFWALRKIAQCNPVREGASVEQAVEDWTAWWDDRNKRHGVLD